MKLSAKVYLRIFFVVSFIVVLTAFTSCKALAFSNISDTITTSRPSASSPLNANAATSDTQLTIFNNSSRYLASDSARILRTSTGGQISSGLIVASQSAGLTTVFLGNTVGAAAQAGTDVLLMPATAMHTVKFTTSFQVSTSDTITISFPTLTTNDANNPASASASTFQLNGLSSTNIKVDDNGSDVSTNYSYSITNPTAGASPKIVLTQTTGTVTSGHTLKIFLGCTAISAGACTSSQPVVINPTKTAALGTGDSWKVAISQAGSATDSTTVGIATIESVTIRASIDPSLSFSIAGIANATAINTANSGCSLATLTNSGINATANEANLGIIQQTPAVGGAVTNTAAQTLTVSTNGPNGYSLTATSSSSLLNPATGFFFHASLTPTNFSNSTLTPAHFFGLHPCGVDVNTTWIEGSATGGSTCGMVAGPDPSTTNECFWAWPSVNISVSTTPLTIASASVGPIGAGNGTAGSGITSIVYAAGADVTVPPGQYRTVITYTATPTF